MSQDPKEERELNIAVARAHDALGAVQRAAILAERARCARVARAAIEGFAAVRESARRLDVASDLPSVADHVAAAILAES